MCLVYSETPIEQLAGAKIAHAIQSQAVVCDVEQDPHLVVGRLASRLVTGGERAPVDRTTSHRGKATLASYALLEQNPLKVDPKTLKDIRVLQTIKEGVTVFSSSTAAGNAALHDEPLPHAYEAEVPHPLTPAARQTLDLLLAAATRR